MTTHPLLRAMHTMLPAAEFTIVASRDWCSLTFAGQQLTIECAVGSEVSVEQVASRLGNHEFSLADMLVADIAVKESGTDGARMVIEALVIQE